MNGHLSTFVKNLLASTPHNRLPQAYGGGPIFGNPLLGASSDDDSIFDKFKEVVAPEHLTPAEMWAQSGLPHPQDNAARLRIVSIVFPYAHQIREAGAQNEGDMPPEVYCVARNFANPLIGNVLRVTVDYLQENGFQAMAGAHSSIFQILRRDDPYRIYSTWSERHAAFAAGLGTFSLHEALITEVGCNIRLGSIITDAPFEVTPRTNNEPYANCLHYANGTCGDCIARCPAGAITEASHDKHQCYLYGRKVNREMLSRPLKSFLKPHHTKVNDEERTSYSVGCALCQFGVPCTDKNPVA